MGDGRDHMDAKLERLIRSLFLQPSQRQSVYGTVQELIDLFFAGQVDAKSLGVTHKEIEKLQKDLNHFRDLIVKALPARSALRKELLIEVGEELALQHALNGDPLPTNQNFVAHYREVLGVNISRANMNKTYRPEILARHNERLKYVKNFQKAIRDFRVMVEKPEYQGLSCEEFMEVKRRERQIRVIKKGN